MKARPDKTPQHAAHRTAWILAIISVTFFVLSIVQQLAIVHHH